MRLVVTTPLHPTPDEVGGALTAAERYALPYAAREGRALTRVVAGAGAEAALVLSRTRAVLVGGGAGLIALGGGYGHERTPKWLFIDKTTFYLLTTDAASECAGRRVAAHESNLPHRCRRSRRNRCRVR